MNAEILLEAIGEIDLNEVRRARPERARRRRKGYIWMGAAAAAVLAVAFALAKAPAQSSGEYTVETVEALENITGSYDGTLLAENLLAAGAELSDIRLEHEKDRDITDASGWRELSFTAESGGEQMRMTCTFDAPEGFHLPDAPDKAIEYGGVTVWLYLDSSLNGAGETERTCRAIFISDGVAYDMDFSLCTGESSELVYEYLAMVLGPEDGGTSNGGTAEGELHPLESLMGFEDYSVTVDVNSQGSTWHFWLDVDGVETCVAEASGSEIYSVDLDGDGTPEAVANDVYGDGAERVRVFRYSDGVFYVGSIPDEYYDKLGFVTWEWAHAVSERYDPERNVFVVENHPQSAGERTETFTGIGPFVFRRFANGRTDHFDVRPLSYDELEPTDVRPIPDLYGDSDYRVGIERTPKEDVWHFWRWDGAALVCLAEATAERGMTPEVYSVDLDGDGVNEFIANDRDGTVKAISRAYGRPASDVRVYAVNGEREFELMSHGPNGSGRVTERYDPEKNEFVLTVTGWGEEEPTYTETFTGLDFGGYYAYSHELYGEPEYFRFKNDVSGPDEKHPGIPGGEKLTAFEPEGRRELDYGGWRTFFIKEDADGAASRLIVRDKGEETDLTGPIEAKDFRLSKFTDLLGCDGVVLEYSGGESTHALFFRVDESGASLLADCDGDVYTGDINSDGIDEIVCDTRGGYPFTYFFDRDGTVKAETAADALRQVLEGERDFKYTLRTGEVCGALNIERAGEVMSDGGSEFMEATHFALVDMDADGTDEAVVQVSKRDGGYEMGFVVLRYNAGEVYGYLFYARELIGLKRDGTFWGSSCASNVEYNRIGFTGLRLDEHTFLGSDIYTDRANSWQDEVYYGVGSMEEYSASLDEQDKKPDAEWLELTDGNIRKAYG